MKAMNRKLYLLVILLMLSTVGAKASHLFGGEITWTCIQSGPDAGKFQFTIKAYRDCQGNHFSPPSNLAVYGNPGLTSIPINAALTQINDLSPPNCGFTCASPSAGAIQEYVMKTNPVFLNGTPPATGWTFAIDDCCRNSLVNLGGGGQGFTIRATMYPYLGLNMNPCYDSSPYFKERPNTYICIGYPYTYNPTAVDSDLDSLRSEWANPIDQPTSSPPAAFNASAINFSAPYSVNNQLPGNVTMNNLSGEVNFFVTTAAGTTGNFATCIKVTSYKCGVKVAEIYRDYGVVLTTNCFVQNPPTINLPPAINLPFAGGTSKDTTVFAGDTVRFRIDATDFQKNIGSGSFQNIRIEAYSDQFGTPINTDGGCQYPPCAYLNKLLPSVSPIANFIQFTWVTNCNHILAPSGCIRGRNTYYFIIKAQDDYCLAPAINTITISITVEPPIALKAPDVRGATVLNPAGDVGLYWNPPMPIDTHNIFNAYYIYASTNQGGPFTLVDSVKGNHYQQKGDTILGSSLTALIGANAANQSIYFYVKTKSTCGVDSLSTQSNLIRTMYLSGVNNCGIQLSWNSLFTGPYPPSASANYNLYRSYPSGSPPVLVTTIPRAGPTTFTDPFSTTICTGNIEYWVSIGDALPCTSNSNHFSIAVNNSFTANISASGPTNVCQGQCVPLTASPSPNNPCFTYNYSWNTGATTSTINACATGAYNATITQSPSGCTSTTSTINVNVTQAPTATIAVSGSSSACLGDSINLQFSFTGAPPWNFSYNVPGPGCVGNTVVNAVANSTPFVVRVPVNCNYGYTLTTVTAGCPGIVSGTANVTVAPKPTAVIGITSNDTICTGGSSTLTINFTGTGPWSYVISSSTGPNISGTTPSNPLLLNVTPASTTTYALVSVADACTGTVSGSRKIVVNPVPTATMSITGNDTICVGSSATIRVNFTGTPPYVGNIRDNTTNTLTPVNTNAAFTTLNVSPTTTTTYTFVNFTSSAKACPGSVANSVTVTVRVIPNANISAVTNPVICLNDSVRMQVSFTGNGAPYTYGLVTNSGGAVNTNAATNPFYFYVHPLASTNYIVTTVSDKYCSRSGINDTVRVTVNPLPTAVLSGANTICAGQSSTLTINFTGTGPFIGSYVATPGSTINFNTSLNPYTVNVTPGATTTYSLGTTISDAKCANTTNPATAVVTVSTLPQAVISGNKTICTGAQDTLLVNFNAGAAPWTFFYKDGLGNTYGPVTTSNNPYKLVLSPTSTTTFQLDSVFSGVCKGSVSGLGAITVRPLPTAVISTASDSICSGGSTNLSIQFTGTAPFSYQLAGQGVQTAASNPQVIPVSPASTINYTLIKVSDQLCTSNMNQGVKVTVLPLPSAVISTTTPKLCIGQSGSITINFTGVGPFTTTYSNGSISNGVNSSTNSTTISVTPPTGTTTYSLTGNVTGLLGCSAPVNPITTQIVVNPLPTMVLGGNSTVCDGVSANFNISFTGTAPYNYTYFNGTANVSGTTSNNPLIVSVTPPVGLTTYTPVSISDNNCTGTAMTGAASVKVNEIPTAILTGNDTICFGSSTSLAIQFTGTPPFDYTYLTNGVTSGALSSPSNTATIPISPSVNSTYALGVNVSDANCTNSAVNQSVYVRVVPTPGATLTGTTAICAGSSTNLTINFTGEAPYSYSYLAGGNSNGPFTTNSPSVTIPVSPASTTIYTLPATITGNGCAGPSSGSAVVSVNAIPQAVITTGSDTLCKGDSTQLSIHFTGVAPYTFQMQGGSTVNTSNSNYSFYVAPQSTTNYTLATINDANCPATINQNVAITVLDNPTVAITTATPSLCNGNSGSITLNFTAYGPYAVTYSDGTTNYPVASNTPSVTIPVTPATTTTYSLSGVVTGLYGCKTNATGSTTVAVHDLPQAVISGSPVICLNETAQIQLQFTGEAPFTYTYLDNVTGQSTTATTSQNPLLLGLSPTTTSTYSLTSINDKNCPGTQMSGMATITVNPLPQPVITGVSAVCEGANSVLSTTLPYTSYLWSNNSSASTLTVNQTGNYTVEVTDANGCKKTSPAFAFIAHPYPVVSFTNDTSRTCEITNIHFFSQTISQPGATFQWSVGDSVFSNMVNPSLVFSVPGTYPIKLVVANPFGCTDSLIKNVPVFFYPLPVAKFKADPMMTNIYSGPVQFTDESDYAVNWKWVFGLGDTLFEQNVSHYFSDIGEFPVKLIVENISGCVDSAEQTIVVNPFWLPNAFTPNNDGRNEVFFDPGFNMDYSGFKLRIFNRWGQMLYQSDSPSSPWDGSDGRGGLAPQGTYVYSLSVTTKGGKRHDYNGTVTLLR